MRIGTRGSQLALTQAHWVKAGLEDRHTDLETQLIKIKTTGDQILDVPLAKVGGKGLFVKEIEEALLREEIDLAVHSMKDVPTALPPELHLGVVTRREDARDVLISADGRSLKDLPRGARVGTSSLRRQAQLLHFRPDLQIVQLRGNLDTRIRKLTDEGLAAIVLAAAGLRRMGWEERVTEYLDPEISLPAVGQGALGIECRVRDESTNRVLQFLNHEPTRCGVLAERAFLRRLEGGCQVPIAAHALILNGSTPAREETRSASPASQNPETRIRLEGMVAGVDGRRLIRESEEGPASQAESLGVRLAERLLQRGADVILNEIYSGG